MLTEQKMQEFRSITSSALATPSRTQSSTMRQPSASPQPTLDTEWADLPGNILPSASAFAGSIFNAVIHPLDTINAIRDVGKGALATYAPSGITDQEGVDGAKQSFENVRDFFIDRYGDAESIKKTIINDPFGFAADISTVLSGGAGTARVASRAARAVGATRAAGISSQASRLLSTAARVTDPVVVGAKAVSKAASAASSRVVKPFSNSKDIAALAAAERLGVDLPASVASNSPIVRNVEAIVSKGLFGGQLYPRVQAVAEAMVGTARDTITKTGAASDLSSTGLAISEGFNKFRQNFMDLKNELYSSIELPPAPAPVVTRTPGYAPSSVYKGIDVAGAGVVKNQKSSDFARAILGQKEGAAAVLGTSKDAKAFAEIAANLSRGDISFSDMRNAIIELNQRLEFSTDPLVTGNKAQWSRLAATMEGEFLKSLQTVNPAAFEKLTSANAYFSDVATQLGTTWAKNIAKFADQPDKILNAILSPSTSIEDIPRILDVVGADAKPAIQASLLEILFNDARGIDGMFKPGGVANVVKKYGENKLALILEPDQLRAVKDIDTISQAMGKAKNITEGSQTAFLNKLASYGVTAMGLSPFAAAKILVGDALLGTFVSSKAGQKFLLDGFKSTKIPEMLHGVAQKATATGEAGVIEEQAE